jgi:hypothetical protein
MFRRYFSRVLFGFAAFVFVVLWAYAYKVPTYAYVTSISIGCVGSEANATSTHFYQWYDDGNRTADDIILVSGLWIDDVVVDGDWRLIEDETGYGDRYIGLSGNRTAGSPPHTARALSYIEPHYGAITSDENQTSCQ